MALVYSLILFLCLKFKSGQLQCVKETVKDSEFSITVTTHHQVAFGDCIRIPYELTFPKNKVKVPYEKIWFRGDPQNTVSRRVVQNQDTKHVFSMDSLPQGEYEYGFKLEWECNQTYVFPTKVRVSVSSLMRKPEVLVPELEEGQTTALQCYPAHLCYTRAKIHWKGLKAAEKYYEFERGFRRGQIIYTPTADDHNTNITCVAEYDNNVVAEKTVTLIVKFAPKFKNGSQCMVKGKLLVCVCISWGNPLSPITWPEASLTDFSINSYSNAQTVNSILTMNAADFYNTSVRCISSNELGLREIAIPIRKNTGDSVNLNECHPSNVALPWITAVSVSLNLVLLISLIICIYKWGKRSQEKPQEETNTYTSLKRAHVEQDYSVISPQPR
ncbi:uncharacterized protein LOC117814521 [Notolabrus celidotus]|uniref:uncharacterized protein LOC117814521 n=1 Tax=Notolabrus celidotus TaxID=1203425 RepID=UPI0014902C79|nr:uncharacterized protein LOC117814521 [Notolabrus celidotus]XP_034541800.1 uncharacterized protein LOC117814521 [Notolabrus celidotus]